MLLVVRRRVDPFQDELRKAKSLVNSTEPKLVLSQDAAEPGDLHAVAQPLRTTKPILRDFHRVDALAPILPQVSGKVVDRAKGNMSEVHPVGDVECGLQIVRSSRAGEPSRGADRDERACTDLLQSELLGDCDRRLPDTNRIHIFAYHH